MVVQLAPILNVDKVDNRKWRTEKRMYGLTISCDMKPNDWILHLCNSIKIVTNFNMATEWWYKYVGTRIIETGASCTFSTKDILLSYNIPKYWNKTMCTKINRTQIWYMFIVKPSIMINYEVEGKESVNLCFSQCWNYNWPYQLIINCFMRNMTLK